MSETRIVSEVYKVDSNIGSVYSFLSDFNRIGTMVNMAKQSGMMPGEANRLAEMVEDVRFAEDSCTLQIKGLGEVTIGIVEKVEPALIKLQNSAGLPFDVTLWIQLLENGPYDTRLKLTLAAELNMMMKMLLKGKLEKGIEELAKGLSKIPYMMLTK